MVEKALKMIVALGVSLGVYFFCEQQTQSFRLWTILSNLPNEPRWDAPIKNEELLNQSFKYLNQGGWCIAFLGEDQKTVLKFYRHDHLHPLSILRDFSWQKLFLNSAHLVPGSKYFQEFPFKSCMLLYQRAQEQSGLLYVHLNKTQDLHKKVTLIDNIGVRHTIDLNRTEFVLQQRAELFVDYLSKCIKESRRDDALRIIDSYFECLLTLCQKGLRDLDREFRDNFGVVDGRVISLDISSFVDDPSLQKAGNYKKEIVLKSHNLIRWIGKRDDALLKYCEDKLTHLIENE